MHEYYLIKQEAQRILFDAGFVEESRDNRPDWYGSIHTIFAKGGQKVRLVWNGKDGFGVAQILHGTQWVDIEAYVPETSEFLENVDKLCKALEKALAELPPAEPV